jgi:hypothetical protein
MLALLHLSARTRSLKDNTFFSRIDEKLSGMREIPHQLELGHFPPRTPQGAFYEADYVMMWTGRVTDLSLIMPWVETAGEDIEYLIKHFSDGPYNVSSPATQQQKWDLYRYILRSEGFIFVAPCDRIFTKEPDLNLVRLLESIIKYKQRTHSPIPAGIAFIFTKYDLVMPDLMSQGIDLTSQDERVRVRSTEEFMQKFLPDTYGVLKFYQRQGQIKKTIFLPSWVDVQRNDQNQMVNWGDGSPRIYIDPQTMLPRWSDYYYNILINWLRSTFAS